MRFPYDLREDARQTAMRAISMLEAAGGRKIFANIIDCDEPIEFIVSIHTLHGLKALKMRKVERWRGWWSFGIDGLVSEFNRYSSMATEGDPVWERLKSICLKGTEWLAYRIRSFDPNYAFSDNHSTFRAGNDEMVAIRKAVNALGASARKELIGVPNAEIFGIKP